MRLVPFAALTLAVCGCDATFGGNDKAVAISPESVDLEFGGSASFTASVKGLSSTQVTWSLQEENAGQVDENGLYTAPSKSGTFHVVVVSAADATFKAVAQVNVVSPSVRVGMGPHLAYLAPGKEVRFSAQVAGTLAGEPTSVEWSVEESGGGTIDATGKYTAPATPGEYHVVVAAVADRTKKDRATVRVEAAGGMPVDRLTVFNPGLTAVGGIPNRTTICRTLSPGGGDDTAAINAAILACPKDQVVKLNAGTFKISGEGIELSKSNVVLRGAGPALTRITRTDTQAFSVIAIGTRYANGKLIKSANLTTDGLKGSYSVTLATAPSPAMQPGELVYLDEATDPNIVHWGDRSPPGDVSRSWFSRMDRPIAQVLEVASVSGTTVTFTTPLHTDYRTAFNAQLSRHGEGGTLIPATRFSGVEDLYVEKGNGGDSGGNIHFFVSSYSWLKNVESKLSDGTAVAFDSTLRCELRDSYIHTSANPNPGGGGYLVGLNQGAADNLVENNVIWSGNKMIVMRASGGGNVISYNYAQDAFGEGYPDFIEVGLNASHMSAAHHELFEGNESFNFDSDAVWGGAIYITVLRNNFTGLRTSRPPLVLTDQSNRRAVGLCKWSWWYSFFGNVLGYEGQAPLFNQQTFAYETVPGVGSASGFDDGTIVPMWQLGYNSEDFQELPDPKVLSTTIRHGNYDYVTNRVVNDAAVTSQTVPDSLYLTQKPAFFGTNAWPWVNPAATNAAERTRVLPAKERFKALP
jgi:hypothetical protein